MYIYTIVEHIIYSSFTCTFFILLLIALKKFLRNRISVRISYMLWIIILVRLSLPYTPENPLNLLKIFKGHKFIPAYKTNFADTAMNLKDSISAITTQTGNRYFDYAVPYTYINRHILSAIVAIYLAVLVTLIFIIIFNNIKLRQTLKYSILFTHSQALKVYENCKIELGIRRNIPLISADGIIGPSLTGIFHPKIILNRNIAEKLGSSRLKYVLLHELMHYKYHDLLTALFSSILQAVYWFNPLILYALHLLKQDMENTCDERVLHVINPAEYKDYGYTILSLVNTKSDHMYGVSKALFSDSKNIIKRRIINIASYRNDRLSKKLLGMSAAVVFLTVVLVTPSMADLNSYDCMSDTLKNNVNQIDASRFFKGYNGSFVLYDIKHKSYTTYGGKRIYNRVPPCSTFKILTALAGLETKTITPSNNLIHWNGIKTPYAAWNKDQTLCSAMQNSVNWYFDNLDNCMGINVLKEYMNKINYGNRRTSGLYSLINNNSLKISPVEQVQFLTRLYTNDVPFSYKSISYTKKSLLLKAENDQLLYGKTGTAEEFDGRRTNGWFVGCYINKGSLYVFATNIQAADKADGIAARTITYNVLNSLFKWNIL